MFKAAAQNISEYQVKAAYLYNFAKFVEWPAQDFAGPTAPIRFCIWDDPSITTELNRVVQGKLIGGRSLEVLTIKGIDQAHSCHLLFISSNQSRSIRHILGSLRDTPLLTVGETEHFIEEGGIINFILEEQHVQFQINHKAATESSLYISSRLLTVAKLVIE